MKTNSFRRQSRGFTLVEIMNVVAILRILVSLALPNFMKTRAQAQKQTCIENLSQIESAKQIWGVETGKKEGDVPDKTDLIGPSLYIKKMPVCPGGGDYNFEAIGRNASCIIGGHVLE